MKSSTGRWVTGANFFDRQVELGQLQQRVVDGNHVSLTGQRRMGKTSVARELGRRLEEDGWVFLFADIEGAPGPEDVIAEIAKAVHPVRPLASRFASSMKRWIGDHIEEISALDFGVRIRAALDAANWRRHGETLLADCARFDRPVLLVIDELPIFLKRILAEDDGPRKVDEFELVQAGLAGSRRRFPGRHRVRQHRPAPAGRTTRHPRSDQSPRPVPARSVGSGRQRGLFPRARRELRPRDGRRCAWCGLRQAGNRHSTPRSVVLRPASGPFDQNRRRTLDGGRCRPGLPERIARAIRPERPGSLRDPVEGRSRRPWFLARDGNPGRSRDYRAVRRRSASTPGGGL
ncbi:MAG: ATP-binding protein [Candidatus Competibacteraceae bacterium]|nr:MAG: ATP-binding protein [Candidatus Competibacteraceae bacterium]